MKDMFDLDGKVAVVTGGAGLIGRGLVEGLADCGAHVYVADINLEAAEESAGRLRQQGLRVSSVVLDIRDYDSISACVDEVVTSAGRSMSG